MRRVSDDEAVDDDRSIILLLLIYTHYNIIFVEAYDHVLRERLLHNFQKRRIST